MAAFVAGQLGQMGGPKGVNGQFFGARFTGFYHVANCSRVAPASPISSGLARGDAKTRSDALKYNRSTGPSVTRVGSATPPLQGNYA